MFLPCGSSVSAIREAIADGSPERLDLDAKRRQQRESRLREFLTTDRPSFLVVQHPLENLLKVFGPCNSLEEIYRNNIAYVDDKLQLDWTDDLPFLEPWIGTGVVLRRGSRRSTGKTEQILMTHQLLAGAAAADITPDDSQFLFGYPHVERISTGVHDRLLSSALFFSDGRTPLMLVANDVIAIGSDTARRVRNRIQEQTEVPAANMLITASHTHSGPLTMDTLASEADPVVPKADPLYIQQLENGIVEAAVQACSRPRPADDRFGGCRRLVRRHQPPRSERALRPRGARPGGARRSRIDIFLAAMIVCSMHPTVLHEDSTLISGDFPAMTRRYLQEHVLGSGLPGAPPHRPERQSESSARD